MAITILHPLPAPPSDADPDSDSASDQEADSDPDSDPDSMPLDAHPLTTRPLVTPGELLASSSSSTSSSSPQFMRGHGTSSGPSLPLSSTSNPSLTIAPTQIHSTLLGTPHLTNKLLTIAPLSTTRYSPSIGDTVLGRIVSVQPKKWLLDIGGQRLASLPPSAITLPGGVQRRRTGADELEMRGLLAEGDVLLAEVQSVYRDGGAGLHTRSGAVGFGKCRNGVLVGGRGGAGGGGVTRARKQVWGLQARGRLGWVDVYAGVNGLVWVCQRPKEGGDGGEDGSGRGGRGGREGLGGLESGTREEGGRMYSARNDVVSVGMRREIGTVCEIVGALLRDGRRVDEETVREEYEEALERELLGEE